MDIKMIIAATISLLFLNACNQIADFNYDYEASFKNSSYYNRLTLNTAEDGQIIVKGEELSILDGMVIHKRSRAQARKEVFPETENVSLVYYIENGEIEIDLKDYSRFGKIVNERMQREDIMMGGIQTDTKFYPLYPKGEAGYNSPTMEMFYTESETGEIDGVKIISKVDFANDITYVEFTYNKELDAFIGECVYYNEAPVGVYPALY